MDAANSANAGLYYRFSRNNTMLVLVLLGRLDANALSILERCRDEALAFDGIRSVIIDFAGVTSIGLETTRALTQLQTSIRADEKEIRISSLAREFREKLEKKGILRVRELAPSLAEAVRDLALTARP